MKEKSFAILALLPGAYTVSYLLYTHIWFAPTWIVSLTLLALGIRVIFKEFSFTQK